MRLLAQHCYYKVLSSIINVPTDDATKTCGKRVATFLAWSSLKMALNWRYRNSSAVRTQFYCADRISADVPITTDESSTVSSSYNVLSAGIHFHWWGFWHWDPRADILAREKFVPCSGRRASTSREQRSSRPRLTIHQTRHQLARPFLKMITFELTQRD